MRTSFLWLTTTVVPFAKAQVWPYKGCYTDTTTSRTLRADHFVDAVGLTPSTGTLLCAHRDFIFGGVEFGSECYCDYLLNPAAVQVSDAECNVMPCAGDPNKTCGAPDRIKVYYNGTPLPTIQQTAGTFTYQGCYTDSVSSRALPTRIDFPFGVRPDTCTSACQAAGYTFAGLEFGRECWCGNSLGSSSVKQPDSDCYMRCFGGALNLCGAPDRLVVYQDGGL